MSAARKTKNGKENKEIKKSETEEDDRKDADRKKKPRRGRFQCTWVSMNGKIVRVWIDR